MLYPYIKFSDNTEVLHTQILRDGTIEVQFERPVVDGFDSARCVMPECKWISNEGYSEKELQLFEDLLKDNVHLMFDFARRGGRNVL